VKRLRLAVAGGRKTQSIIDECASASSERRILVLTYTQANQQEVGRRLASGAPLDASVTVLGWFSFLMTHWVRPYIPRLFSDSHLQGLNFDGDPGQYTTGRARFLDGEGRAYKRHLAHLAGDVNVASSGAVLDRLSRLYDTLYVDEVQDLNGYDLEILDALIDSPISLTLVGDVRQALLLTNPRDPKNKQYKGAKIKDWLDKRCTSGRLCVTHESRTWRCNQSIADFADSIFDESWGFHRRSRATKNSPTTTVSLRSPRRMHQPTPQRTGHCASDTTPPSPKTSTCRSSTSASPRGWTLSAC
jgi:DNA helicase-2/ATP-dependent DNA helicase PcrA